MSETYSPTTITPTTAFRLCKAPWMEPRDLPESDDDLATMNDSTESLQETCLAPEGTLLWQTPRSRSSTGSSTTSVNTDHSDASTCVDTPFSDASTLCDALPPSDCGKSVDNLIYDVAQLEISYSESPEVSLVADASAVGLSIDVNDSVHSFFDYAGFDFHDYVNKRVYAVSSISVPSGECFGLLDQGVRGLIPKALPELDDVRNCKAVDVRSSSIHRLGLFSRQTFHAGETILLERPTVLIPYIMASGVALEGVFSQLSSIALQEVHRMALVYNVDASGQPITNSELYEEIIEVRGLALQLDVPEDDLPELQTHRGLFLKTSWCNHSCGPNASWSWDYEAFTLKLTAIRTITPDEEITIPYISLAEHYESRQESLQRLLGFDTRCHCPICQRQSLNIADSDASRDFLLTFWNTDGSNLDKRPSFEEWCMDSKYSDRYLINLHERAVKIIDDEGLHMFDMGPGNHPAKDYGRHLDAIAMCYGALKDEDKFKEWMGRASKARVLASQGDERAKKQYAFNCWLEEPSKFPLWGSRNCLTREGGEGEDVERKSWIANISARRSSLFRRQRADSSCSESPVM